MLWSSIVVRTLDPKQAPGHGDPGASRYLADAHSKWSKLSGANGAGSAIGMDIIEHCKWIKLNFQPVLGLQLFYMLKITKRENDAPGKCCGA
jgi:hypothetical protein